MKLNNNLPYAIISKKECRLYLFDRLHRLIGKHELLLGADTGDEPNDAFVEEEKGKTRTTPSGMYHIDTRKAFPKDYAGPGDYLSLVPEEGQYDPKVLNKKTGGQYTL